jgi:hypothetical protein
VPASESNAPSGLRPRRTRKVVLLYYENNIRASSSYVPPSQKGVTREFIVIHGASKATNHRDGQQKTGRNTDFEMPGNQAHPGSCAF